MQVERTSVTFMIIEHFMRDALFINVFGSLHTVVSNTMLP